MPEPFFDEWIAPRYAVLWPELFDPAVVGPAVEFLADLAGAGGALELGIGTGRVALPLSRRGVRVRGVELSAAMAHQLQVASAGEDIDVVIGDLATTTLGETFGLVYLLRNTITNLTSQDHQIEAFRNAARHVKPGGCFVVENYVPQLRRLPSGEKIHVFAHTATHVGFEEYDVESQIAYSHWSDWKRGPFTGDSRSHISVWQKPSTGG